MSTGTVWQQNAQAFASTPETYIDAERHVGVRKATGLLLARKPGRALYELTRSVERQARIAGLGSHDLQPVCPCNGRCEQGGAR